MKGLFFGVIVSFIGIATVLPAQTTISANEVLAQIDRQEPLVFSNVTITGDLDFTLLSKTYRGGSYGIRGGQVKEFFTKVLQPVRFTNCQFTGDIKTTRETRSERLVSEFFTAFDAQLAFENCQFAGKVSFERLTFYQGVSIRECTFAKPLVFQKVHFAQEPDFFNNTYEQGLTNKDTNWPPPPPVTTPASEDSGVTLILKNPTLKAIKISFGKTVWNLSPLGSSSLLTTVGQEIYVLNSQQKRERLLVTVTKSLDGQAINVADH
ncbi:MAG: pentapeptide repeat-containing protein [Lewinellaceae bacterium]|nr:pentapeptide repeat-containing protein [Lewinellaceae bacterium]